MNCFKIPFHSSIIKIKIGIKDLELRTFGIRDIMEAGKKIFYNISGVGEDILYVDSVAN